MAEPLTNKYGRDVPVTIANMIDASVRRFPRQVFLNKAIDNFESLGLMDRVRQIARALGTALPEDFPKAVDCILSSLGPELDATSDFGMQPFLYLPFTFFVADRGLDHFDVSMRAQYELTKRSTAEFSIRSFLVHDQARTLGCLRTWAEDSNPHVRRLVSEGTRPRLPWAPRLREFQKNPHPVVSLLELLKDDDVEYVRRSVANNLNDIGKDNPQTLIAVARKWSRGASRSRMRIVRHALRSAPGGDIRALAVLGLTAR
jgi:3-methyladenine DNA glycosylase AlkC